MYHTQGIGIYISESEYGIIKEINKNAHLSMRLRLRKLQHKAIEHVWRPDGAIVGKIKKKFKN